MANKAYPCIDCGGNIKHLGRCLGCNKKLNKKLAEQKLSRPYRCLDCGKVIRHTCRCRKCGIDLRKRRAAQRSR